MYRGSPSNKSTRFSAQFHRNTGNLGQNEKQQVPNASGIIDKKVKCLVTINDIEFSGQDSTYCQGIENGVVFAHPQQSASLGPRVRINREIFNIQIIRTRYTTI